MKTLRAGLSPCPNDTFVFHALLHGLVPLAGYRIVPRVEDVETLNHMAARGLLEVTKISFHAYGYLEDRYRLLRSGAAVGRGCGPLLVCRPESRDEPLAGARIAIPGELTTAALLLRLHAPEVRERQLLVMPFHRIPVSVAAGEADFGTIIHESRFTYAAQGLVAREDLGRWWEETEGLPIPLGGIIARRDLGDETFRRIEEALRASVLHAREHPEDSQEYVRRHAQELSEEVIQAHIDLYVNDFTVDLGEEGARAVDRLLDLARQRGVLPPSTGPARRS